MLLNQHTWTQRICLWPRTFTSPLRELISDLAHWSWLIPYARRPQTSIEALGTLPFKLPLTLKRVPAHGSAPSFNSFSFQPGRTYLSHYHQLCLNHQLFPPTVSVLPKAYWIYCLIPACFLGSALYLIWLLVSENFSIAPLPTPFEHCLVLCFAGN